MRVQQGLKSARNLMRVFAVRMKKPLVIKNVQWRLLSDSENAQADLILAGRTCMKVRFLMLPLILKPDFHYENTPIQVYRKFYLQKLKIFR